MIIPNANVYEAIKNVMAEIGTAGISKDRNNQQQGYKFRGIDDVYNALNPVLARHGLILLPKVLERSQVERQSSKGNTLIYTTLTVQFTAVAMDGSTAEIVTVGEAMDSADKSSNKAMAAAYKYAAMMLFCIPTEGDNDADATTHELAPRSTATSNDAPETLPKAFNATKTETNPIKDALCRAIWDRSTRASLEALGASSDFLGSLQKLNDDLKQVVRETYAERLKELLKGLSA
jgi:ERF superfamily